MNIEIIKELFAVANELDAKGFRKEADTIDGIVKKAEDWLGRPDSFAEGMGGQVATLEGPVIPEDSSIRGARDRYLARRDSRVGRIQPPGDPYTYDYLPKENYFVVRTDPNPGSPAVGAKLKEGTRAYAILSTYLGDDMDRLKGEILLTDQIAEGELKAPNFDGHIGMQYLYSDVVGEVGDEEAKRMFDQAESDIQALYRGRNLDEDTLDGALRSAGFKPEYASDYLYAIRHLPMYTQSFSPKPPAPDPVQESPSNARTEPTPDAEQPAE